MRFLTLCIPSTAMFICSTSSIVGQAGLCPTGLDAFARIVFITSTKRIARNLESGMNGDPAVHSVQRSDPADAQDADGKRVFCSRSRKALNMHHALGNSANETASIILMCACAISCLCLVYDGRNPRFLRQVRLACCAARVIRSSVHSYAAHDPHACMTWTQRVDSVDRHTMCDVHPTHHTTSTARPALRGVGLKRHEARQCMVDALIGDIQQNQPRVQSIADRQHSTLVSSSSNNCILRCVASTTASKHFTVARGA